MSLYLPRKRKTFTALIERNIALYRSDSKFSMEFRRFMDKIVCNQENESCILGECTSCHTIATLKPIEINSSIKW